MHKPAVLCVDDEAFVLHTIGLVLERAGYCVSLASTVEDALRLLELRHFDLLLIDCLPDFQRVVKVTKRAHPSIKIAICTGDPGLADSTLVDVVLQKPLPPPELLSATARLLSDRCAA